VRITWGDLVAVETRDIGPHAEALAAAYNHPANAPLIGNTQQLTSDDVAAHYADIDHPFILLREGQLAGDGDLRGVITGDACEFAFLITDPHAQGRGLGTRFAQMVHAAAFHELGLRRIYASVVPANAASLRVFAKLGYRPDEDRRFAEDPDDLVLSIDRGTFERVNAASIASMMLS
jgi:RimJ/RimL family protein N-acetyltransferase